MPRKLIGGLIQCSNPINDESVPVAKVKQAMFDKHVPFIEEAGKKGVQVLCLQEIFNGPYFCPGQDKRWYDAAEPVPGPTTEAVAKLAAKYKMAVVVPVYEKDMPGMLYFRGPDQYTAMARHGIALKHPDKIKIVAPFQAVPGRTYRVVNDYDMSHGLYTVTVTDVATGEVKSTLLGAPNVTKFTLKTGDRFLIDMGFPEGVTVDEVPGYNWTWSDVRVEVYK